MKRYCSVYLEVQREMRREWVGFNTVLTAIIKQKEQAQLQKVSVDNSIPEIILPFSFIMIMYSMSAVILQPSIYRRNTGR